MRRIQQRSQINSVLMGKAMRRIQQRSQIHSVLMVKAMPLRQMVGKLVLARKAVARGTAWTLIRVAVEAGRGLVGVFDVPVQVTFAGV